MFKAAEALNMPAAYSTTVIGRGREFERTLTEFLLAFALVGRVHVHDPGLAIREPDPPGHDPA